ncbi:hypothetical protein, partial [Phyllobacterium bourgognense]|uniref:hypothetical protein n=1 Tax=Phyllobacterium bourgognense TaxID=314236 RepID=UPI0015F05681
PAPPAASGGNKQDCAGLSGYKPGVPAIYEVFTALGVALHIEKDNMPAGSDRRLLFLKPGTPDEVGLHAVP